MNWIHSHKLNIPSKFTIQWTTIFTHKKKKKYSSEVYRVDLKGIFKNTRDL